MELACGFRCLCRLDWRVANGHANFIVELSHDRRGLVPYIGTFFVFYLMYTFSTFHGLQFQELKTTRNRMSTQSILAKTHVVSHLLA